MDQLTLVVQDQFNFVAGPSFFDGLLFTNRVFETRQGKPFNNKSDSTVNINNLRSNIIFI